jgi:flagellar FliL protein
MAAATDTAPAPRKGPSLIVQIAVLLVLSGAAIGAGWFAGQMMGARGAPEPAAEPAPAKEGSAHEAPGPQALNIFPLATITTNLADPRDLWIRLELALVFKDQVDARIAEMVNQDVLAYLRTVKSRQIEGPSGLQHLRSDLDERAQTRSQGKVTQVLIRTLLFE